MVASLASVLSTIEHIISGDRSDVQSNKNVDAIVSSGGSIVRLVSTFNLEPIYFISDKASKIPELNDVIKINTNILMLFYTQAITALVEIYDIKPDVAFDILSTRTTRRGYAGYAELGKELSHTLESLDVAVETLQQMRDQIVAATEVAVNTKDDKKFSSMISKVNIREFTISVTINKERGNSYRIEIPCSIKAKTIVTPTIEMMRFLEDNSYRTKAWFRFDQAMAGAITWKNFFLGSDLIKKRKENRLKSKADIHALIRDVTIKSASKLAAHGALGYDMFYNTVILSKDDVQLINPTLKNELYTYNGKEEFMLKFRALSLAVLDQEWDTCDFFTKDIEGYSTEKLSKLKDKDNIDKFGDMFKNLLNNKPIFGG